MFKPNFDKKNLEQRLVSVVDRHRSTILDSIEQEISDRPNWPFLRSRLLKALGDRGIAGGIREVLADEFGA